jgi:microcystin-dependent protein
VEYFISQIVVFCGTFAPKGFMVANGQSLPIQENPTLYSLIGSTFGGDDRTFFNLPKLNDETANVTDQDKLLVCVCVEGIYPPRN